jgi:Domain of unknown function (DUF1918)
VQATVGDHIEVRGHKVGDGGRRGEIIDIKGPGGNPPYVVRWSDGHEGIFFPGPDAEVEHMTASGA